MKHCPLRVAAILAAGTCTPAFAQFAPVRIILCDRTNNAMWVLYDANGNGVIDEPDEIARFFGTGNVESTVLPLAPVVGARADGLVIACDNDANRRGIFTLRDRDRDGTAQGQSESKFSGGPGNGSGVLLNSPQGVAFDAAGHCFVSNSGNTSGPDAIYQIEDVSLDGTFNQAAEITAYVGASVFGATNGAYVPGEMCNLGNAMYMRDSGSTTHGIYRVDGPGILTPFWTLAASGVTPGAGLQIGVDPVHPRSVYTIQVTSVPSTGTDLLIRVSDLNNNGSANDPGEAVVVYQTSEGGFTAAGIIALPDGRVFLSDNSGNRIICLNDTNHDGLFDSSERTTFFANTGGQVASARSMAVYPLTCPSDIATEGNGDPLAGPDGFVTGVDLDVFILSYYKELRRACDGNLLADITDGTGTGGPDGFLTGTDVDKYIEFYFKGC